MTASSTPRSVLDTLHVTRWGLGGQRVLMIHGGVQGSASAGERNFAAQEPLAGEGWELIVPDRPGHGLSEDPGRGDDAEADAIWVAELLGDGGHLVGHSFGGLVAAAAAALRPDAVFSLVLIEPAMHKIAIGSPAVRRFLLQMVWAMATSLSPIRRAERVMHVLGIPVSAFGHDTAELKRMGTALPRGRFPSKKSLLRDLSTIRSANIPLLVISGGWSGAFVETGTVVAAIGGGEHVIAPAQHHFPQWNGAAFNSLLTKFWRRSDAIRANKDQ